MPRTVLNPAFTGLNLIFIFIILVSKSRDQNFLEVFLGTIMLNRPIFMMIFEGLELIHSFIIVQLSPNNILRTVLIPRFLYK